jgi:hypothetical protein
MITAAPSIPIAQEIGRSMTAGVANPLGALRQRLR